MDDDLLRIRPDLAPPPATRGEPAPGRRVLGTLRAWSGSEVRHALFLPEDWKPRRRYPVLVEYAGNGGYRGELGDICTGRVTESCLGYGISGGRGLIWACAPYVEAGGRDNALIWWGDIESTVRYCIALVREICARWGGDSSSVFIAGFSRGAIATSYVGLHDDTIAGLWRGFMSHSHYDGVYDGWGYPECDRQSARRRLDRLAGRAQFVSSEQTPRLGLEATRAWLTEALADDPVSLRAVTFCALPFRNHTDSWVLRDLPQRRTLRDWLDRELGRPLASPR